MFQLDVMRFLVMQFDNQTDSMIQISPSLSLDNARKFIANSRDCEPTLEFYLIAVLEE